MSGLSALILAAASATLDPSIVIAGWDERLADLPMPAECRGEEICLNTRALVRFRRDRVLAGPPLPARFVAAHWYHGQPLPTTRVILRVERRDDGTLNAVRIGYVRPGDDRACFPKSDAAGLRVARAERGAEPGEICVRL